MKWVEIVNGYLDDAGEEPVTRGEKGRLMEYATSCRVLPARLAAEWLMEFRHSGAHHNRFDKFMSR